jgi:H+/gluconate symporter-like permease
VLGIVLLQFLIIKARLQPFVALLAVSIAVALAARLLGAFGERRAPLAMGLTGLVFGIPVFFDVGIFLLAPLVYAAARRASRSCCTACRCSRGSR